MKSVTVLAAFRQRMDRWFVDREFIMRADGEVRFLKVSARLQKRIAGMIALALGIWALATLTMIGNQFALTMERSELSERQQSVQTAEQRVAAYRDSIDDVADDIEQRQDMLDTLWQSYFGDAPHPQPQADATGSAEDELARKVSAAVPEASKLARLEQRQLVFVARLSQMADKRADAAASRIRSFGLDPKRIVANDRAAAGGPFIPYFSDKKDVSDPRFAKLADSLDRMNALETALANVPSANPSILRDMTSRFGYRRDPITGRSAYHNGIDFRGAKGSAILAAADGKVVFAGRKGGYGNAIEVDHGNGIVTRYAHMSGLMAHVGQEVARGEQIGRMGSTGRSTGTHLHFEVRVNGKAVDPARFLGKADVR